MPLGVRKSTAFPPCASKFRAAMPRVRAAEPPLYLEVDGKAKLFRTPSGEAEEDRPAGGLLY